MCLCLTGRLFCKAFISTVEKFKMGFLLGGATDFIKINKTNLVAFLKDFLIVI